MLSRARVGFRTVVGVLAVLAAASSAAADKPQFLNSPRALELDRPFSEAVRAGDFLFLSGAIGEDPATGKLPAGGIQPEARQTLKNVKSVLEANGASLDDVVKCTVFLADIAEWPAFNTVYREFFKKPFPARSALAASGLAMNARVELECIAYVPQKGPR
ncbi:RidA family protein [Steroidobacter sp. S1-65]|uniref:RidA family protein n=1 Tax=Steroidobacter gossypii TaxID=2805490 RepID=A0ABS1X6G0_9GAMM|nr:Rid family detoxifying hydrolase [Steroidobacter gossypii]MBM0108799.1 RidA family protein [Steroidobacter gossypii]